DRTITAQLTVSGLPEGSGDFTDDIQCFLTTEKGWLEIEDTSKHLSVEKGVLELSIAIDGGAPPILPYTSAVHGYAFETSLPMLLVTLKQDDTRAYGYSILEKVVV